jgi:hypothetical protein
MQEIFQHYLVLIAKEDVERHPFTPFSTITP